MLDDKELEKYNRQIIIPDFGIEGQNKLKASKVLIIGLGGLGSGILYYLVSSGIGEVGILDKDVVEYSNLNRQILHYEEDVGLKKTDSAFEKLTRLNKNLIIKKYFLELNEEKAKNIFLEYDFIIDASDNFHTKFLVNDLCVQLKKPFVVGGVYQFEGQLLTVIPGETACYRCVFKEEPPEGTYPTTTSGGIMGTIAGFFGIIEANEAIKFLVFNDKEKLLTNKMLHADLLYNSFEIFEVEKDEECSACSF